MKGEDHTLRNANFPPKVCDCHPGSQQEPLDVNMNEQELAAAALDMNDEFEEVEGQTEGVDDAGVEQDKFSSTTIIQTDWTVSTIIDQARRGIINVNPDFQRRDAWDKYRKTNYIESLILGIPVPPIVLAELPGKKGKFIVIDGKQRLLSMLQFFARKDDPHGFQPFRLREPPIIKAIAGMNIDALASTEYHSALENQSVRTNVIRGVRDEDVLYQIFLRLNTGSVKLAAHELRQALHPGEFLKLLDKYCGESEGLRYIFKGKTPDFRMRDAELLLRYLAFRTQLPAYEGNLKLFLDDTVKVFQGQWSPDSDELVRAELDRFEKGVAATRAIFGDDGAFKFWNQTRYENRFNRAVFDVMLYYFAHELTRTKALEKRGEVEEAFRRLCILDRDFSFNVRLTTKSIEATDYRIAAWGAALRELLGEEVEGIPVVGRA